MKNNIALKEYSTKLKWESFTSMRELSDKIYVLRVSKKLSDTEFAREYNIPNYIVRRLESGMGKFNVSNSFNLMTKENVWVKLVDVDTGAEYSFVRFENIIKAYNKLFTNGKMTVKDDITLANLIKKFSEKLLKMEFHFNYKPTKEEKNRENNLINDEESNLDVSTIDKFKEKSNKKCEDSIDNIKERLRSLKAEKEEIFKVIQNDFRSVVIRAKEDLDRVMEKYGLEDYNDVEYILSDTCNDFEKSNFLFKKS